MWWPVRSPTNISFFHVILTITLIIYPNGKRQSSFLLPIGTYAYNRSVFNKKIKFLSISPGGNSKSQHNFSVGKNSSQGIYVLENGNLTYFWNIFFEVEKKIF